VIRVIRNDWSAVAVPELGAWTPTSTVSVVVPAYQCQASLDLVLAALAGQTYPAELLDVVVVDDGSQPRLRLSERRPANTTLIWAPDRTDGWGIASACDIGFRASTGEIVLRLDADMVVYPEHVEAHARWHHAIPYAVTLGYKRFVDRAEWPAPAELVARGVPGLFDEGEPHQYVEELIERTDQLRAADHTVFRAHVGATVAVRRELYEVAGGYDPVLRRGSDTEFGYRLTQAGAVFVPEPAAKSWHLGASNMMRDQERIQRYSRPFLADRMPHPRWLRRAGGTGWSVPLATVAMEVDGQPLEVVRTAVDAILRGAERDVRVLLVGGWDKVTDERQPVLADPVLDLRLVAASYQSDPRVRLVDRVPESVFPSPYLLRVPATAALTRTAIPTLIAEADRAGTGLIRVDLPSGGTVELWRTAALGRARWTRRDGESLADAVAAAYGVRAMSTDDSGGFVSAVPLAALDGGPATIEVGGLRSWARATVLVARLTVRRLLARLRR